MTSAILCMHAVALLWGIAGVLGAITSLDSTILVTGRATVALLTVLCWYGQKTIAESLKLSRKDLLSLLLTGILLGIHWIFFFRAISLGSVALALVTYSAGPAMIAGAEVCLGWAPFRWKIFLGAITSWLGVWCIHPVRNFAELMNPGFVSGVLSSVAIVLVALSGKRLLKREVSSVALTMGQLVGAILISLPFALAKFPVEFTQKDVLVILGLGVFCSALGQSLFNWALTSVRVSTASIIAAMETPYGIVLAALLISQPLSVLTVLGTCLVTASAIVVSLPDLKRPPRDQVLTPI